MPSNQPPLLLSGIRSLGYRTDAMLLALGGAELTMRERYLAVRTPQRPTFYSGNFLLYPHPPGRGDRTRWETDFVREFANPPLHHRTFGWDQGNDQRGHTQPFIDAGYELSAMRVLSATAITAMEPDSRVTVRPIASDADWQAVAALQLVCDDKYRDIDPNYPDFKRRQIKAHRDMAMRGVGAWFGAFIAGRLVADLGIYARDGVARYQSVETHPQFRRRGLCRRLVSYAAAYARDQLGATTLVIVADPEYHAMRIYQRLGFTAVEWQFELVRLPQSAL